MPFTKLMALFVKESPACVMTQLLMQATLCSDELEQQLRAAAGPDHCHRRILYTPLVELMGLVVTGRRPSVNAAAKVVEVNASIQALYGKLARLHPGVGQTLLRASAANSIRILEHLGSPASPGSPNPVLPGYETFIADGNHLAGTDHRIKEMRDKNGAALPGHCVVIYDADRRLIADVFPCEDAHVQERRLIPEMLTHARPGRLYLADRNFSTNGCVLGFFAAGACFLIHRHGSNLVTEEAGTPRDIGEDQGRRVSEQTLRVKDKSIEKSGPGDAFGVLRQITIHRSEKDGGDIRLVTNLPAEIGGLRVATLYRTRWKIEEAFGELTRHLGCEVDTLCYPRAALFAFCVALTCYNLLSLVRAAIAAAHGRETEAMTSTFYLTEEVSATHRGRVGRCPVLPTDDA